MLHNLKKIKTNFFSSCIFNFYLEIFKSNSKKKSICEKQKIQEEKHCNTIILYDKKSKNLYTVKGNNE